MTTHASGRVQHAIDDSIRDGSHATLDGGRVDTSEWVDLARELEALADGWTDRDPQTRDYWGTDEDGDSWRVRLSYTI